MKQVTMKLKEEWVRPQDVKVWRTKEPKEMLGKYLPKRVLKIWNEDFSDEDTGEVVTIERCEVICESGLITQEKLQTIMFAIQSGDIEDVEVCERPMTFGALATLSRLQYFMVELNSNNESMKLAVAARSIPKAIEIASDFGMVYLLMGGIIYATKVSPIMYNILSDHDACIPEDERKDETDGKPYFRVTVKMEWLHGDKLKKSTTEYVVNAADVGQAKERIARKLDIMRHEDDRMFFDEFHEHEKTVTIYKAVPFAVDYIVPMTYSYLYEDKKEEAL